MHTIHKFKLAIVDEQVIPMPMDARVLSVKEQHGDLCIWAAVNTAMPLVDRTFRIHGTGHVVLPPPEGLGAALVFLDTVLMHGGQLVWHVFEVTKPTSIPLVLADPETPGG